MPFLKTHHLMKYDEMLAAEDHRRQRKKPGDEEHRLQVACVKWFRLQYPKLRDILFAVPNGGRRDAVTGAKLKDEGATKGVADLILLKPNRYYGGLAIEMKKPGGYQSPAQRQWQHECEAAGNKYAVCRSLDEFKSVVTDYLNDV